MEPTIYKPGAYKSPGIYNGAGGIYNGRGLYNDGEAEIVEIGGRIYPIVNIGGAIWTAENIDYTDDVVKCSYPNNDPQTYGYDGLKYGSFYNKSEYDNLTQYIITNYPNWRPALVSDFQQLSSEIGGDTLGLDLCSSSGWNGLNGNDTYKFNLKPTGYINNNGVLIDEHQSALLRTNYGHCWIMPNYTNHFDFWNNDYNTTFFKFPVRLVRDLL